MTHYTNIRPTLKVLDARGFYDGYCSCGYTTAPGSAGEVRKAVQMHFEAKHSHSDEPPK